MQFKERQNFENRKQEHEAEFERRKLEHDAQLEEKRIQLEHDKLSIEERIKCHEIEAKLEADKSVRESSEKGELSKSEISTSVKLPKLDFPKFNGAILKYKEFWDSFDAGIHQNTTLKSVEKLNYLKAKLEGPALLSIGGLEITNENYEVALKF